jgi:RNA polymerase sigma-B factor
VVEGEPSVTEPEVNRHDARAVGVEASRPTTPAPARTTADAGWSPQRHLDTATVERTVGARSAKEPSVTASLLDTVAPWDIVERPADTPVPSTASAAGRGDATVIPLDRAAATLTDTAEVEDAPQRRSDRATYTLLSTMAYSTDERERRRARQELIEFHLPLARYFARRFRNRGEPYEDLVQVATVGLIKSIDGFDFSRGVEFSSYAMPTIVGELKRHFRDKGWSVRVPRRLQELKIEIAGATTRLTQQLGRSPTVRDLSTALGITEEEVLESLEASNAYSALSIYAPVGADEQAPCVADMLGEVDADLEKVEDRESLRPLLADLPVREQRILAMRFFGNMTQTQIADEIGVSQMHVSRLLSRSLAVLRAQLLVDD